MRDEESYTCGPCDCVGRTFLSDKKLAEKCAVCPWITAWTGIAADPSERPRTRMSEPHDQNQLQKRRTGMSDPHGHRYSKRLFPLFTISILLYFGSACDSK